MAITPPPRSSTPSVEDLLRSEDSRNRWPQFMPIRCAFADDLDVLGKDSIRCANLGLAEKVGEFIRLETTKTLAHNCLQTIPISRKSSLPHSQERTLTNILSIALSHPKGPGNFTMRQNSPRFNVFPADRVAQNMAIHDLSHSPAPRIRDIIGTHVNRNPTPENLAIARALAEALDPFRGPEPAQRSLISDLDPQQIVQFIMGESTDLLAQKVFPKAPNKSDRRQRVAEIVGTLLDHPKAPDQWSAEQDDFQFFKLPHVVSLPYGATQEPEFDATNLHLIQEMLASDEVSAANRDLIG